MKTQRVLGLVLLAMMLASMTVFAIDEDVAEPALSTTSYYSGSYASAPFGNLGYNELGFFDKLKVGSDVSDGLTTVGGALCSSFPERELEYTPSSPEKTRVCYTNTQHIGVAWQAFEITNTGWQYLGERQLLQDDRQCFNVEYGKDYMLHWYYCDQTTKTCTNYQSESSCEDPASTVRVRTCTENGNTNTERVTVNYWDANAPQTCSGNTGNTDGGSTDVGGGDSNTNNGETYTCQGSWESIAFPTNILPGEKFDGVGIFVPTADGKCILSATMPAQASSTLQTVEARGSACGQPDPHVAEKLVTVRANEKVTVQFKDMQARTNTGIYSMYVGAWDGCFVDGGEEQASTFQPVNVLTLGQLLDKRAAALGGLSGIMFILGAALVVIGAVFVFKSD